MWGREYSSIYRISVKEKRKYIRMNTDYDSEGEDEELTDRLTGLLIDELI